MSPSHNLARWQPSEGGATLQRGKYSTKGATMGESPKVEKVEKVESCSKVARKSKVARESESRESRESRLFYKVGKVVKVD